MKLLNILFLSLFLSLSLIASERSLSSLRMNSPRVSVKADDVSPVIGKPAMAWHIPGDIGPGIPVALIESPRRASRSASVAPSEHSVGSDSSRAAVALLPTAAQHNTPESRPGVHNTFDHLRQALPLGRLLTHSEAKRIESSVRGLATLPVLSMGGGDIELKGAREGSKKIAEESLSIYEDADSFLAESISGGRLKGPLGDQGLFAFAASNGDIAKMEELITLKGVNPKASRVGSTALTAALFAHQRLAVTYLIKTCQVSNEITINPLYAYRFARRTDNKKLKDFFGPHVAKAKIQIKITTADDYKIVGSDSGCCVIS